MDAYRDQLQSFVYASGTTMKPIFTMAKTAAKKRVALCEGEEERVMRAAQIVVDEGVARPTLIGRPRIIAERVEKFGLRLLEGRDYDVVNVEQDDRYRDFWQTYHRMTERKGVTVQMAKIEMRRRLTLIGAMLLQKDQVDGMICGTWGTTDIHLRYVDQVIGKRAGVKHLRLHERAAAAGTGRSSWVDTPRQLRPRREQLAEITQMAAEEMLRFGVKPRSRW
jgi:malate dehydrogenase (oxaloacetate-decarboxylating)(NADP+)